MRHQPTHEGLQILILIGVLGGHNEPELVAIAARTLEERLAVHYVLVGRIEGARLAFAGHTVTLDIAEVSAGAADALSAELDGAHLDDDPARPEGAEPVARSQHPRDARAASDPAAVEAAALAGFHRSEEHTSELQSLMRNSYAVFCLK